MAGRRENDHYARFHSCGSRPKRRRVARGTSGGRTSANFEGRIRWADPGDQSCRDLRAGERTRFGARTTRHTGQSVQWPDTGNFASRAGVGLTARPPALRQNRRFAAAEKEEASFHRSQPCSSASRDLRRGTHFPENIEFKVTSSTVANSTGGDDADRISGLGIEQERVISDSLWVQC